MKSIFDYETLSKIRVIGIFGQSGSGKTALSFRILDEFKGKKEIYFVAHPQPYLIETLGYNNIDSISEIQNLDNCVVYWDEPQLSIAVKDYKKGIMVSKVCSLARQKGINLIMSSSDTRTFSTAVEAYIDGWIVKDIDYSMTKQRSKIRDIICKHSLIDPSAFSLKKDFFIFESRTLRELNGKYKFNLSPNWSEELSNAYSNS